VNGQCDAGQVGRIEAQKALETMKAFHSVLGVLSFEKQEELIPDDLQEAFEKRLQARQDKNWKLADELRDLIHQRGYMIEDTPHGARLKKA
jgi:cysteinyl-tRNA synthetase